MIFLWIYIIGLPIVGYVLYKDGVKEPPVPRFAVLILTLSWPVSVVLFTALHLAHYLSKNVGE